MTSNSKKWFRLFASCQLVRGKDTSILYDLQHATLFDLPNDYLQVLELSKTADISAIRDKYNAAGNFVDDLFSHFADAGFGFFTDDPASFPDIDFTWESPYAITNSIIELDSTIAFDFADVTAQLAALPCRAVQLRLLCDLDYGKVKEYICSPFRDSRINYIELLLPYSSAIQYKALYELIVMQPRLQRIFIYAADEDKIVPSHNPLHETRIVQFKKDIRTDPTEIIKPERFFTNINMFAEAQQYNLGLNRKIAIDRKGNIRNYPTHKKAFGNVKTHKICDIVENKSFREKWTISNDKIELCKDCQYRYACVSNSDIVKRQNKYYKTESCGLSTKPGLWS